MQVLISAEGEHDPKGHHLMVVDCYGFLIDLSGVQGSLVDPTITRVTWGMQLDGTTLREGGIIYRQDGHQQHFWDRALLQPYLDAYEARRVELDAAMKAVGAS